MKKMLVLAILSSAGFAVQAEDVYGGVGIPGLVTLGYAKPMAADWGLRGEIGTGLSLSKDGVRDGVNVTGKLKSDRAGAYADWFPFQGTFRLVGGLVYSDMKAELNAVGSGNASINNHTIDMTGKRFDVTIKYPTITPYVGLGWGHQATEEKGLGFYADIGVTVGKFDASVSQQGIIGVTAPDGTKISQSDIDAQTQKLRDGLSKLSVFPSASIGLVYRF